MFATSTAHRAAGQMIVASVLAILIAAIVGIAVGSALKSWTAEGPRTATAAFSADALAAVQAARGDPVAASGATSDHALRHGVASQGQAAANAQSDYALRHRPQAPQPAPSTQRAPGAPQPD